MIPAGSQPGRGGSRRRCGIIHLRVSERGERWPQPKRSTTMSGPRVPAGSAMARNMEDGDTRWFVEVDASTCTLCEVCARKCPTGALYMQRKDGVATLRFKFAACDGCGGETPCVVLCPEKTVTLVQVAASHEHPEDVVLSESEMVQCSTCQEYFTPDAKLKSLKEKGLGHEVEQSLCPLCRRTHLVVQYIDEKRAPGQEAKYRSAPEGHRTSRRRPVR